MKYIRTKNNILDIEDTVRTRDEKKLLNYNGELVDILKQSDTIEELCDEFVLYEDTHYCIVSDVEAEEMATTNYGTIYGAIWTDKGLIYVAKMNEKGELELL